MMRSWPPKDPDARVQRWFDLREVLTARSTTLASYTLALDDSPDSLLVIENDAESGGLISLWIKDGTLGETYIVRCRFTLADGFRDDISRQQLIEQA